MDYVKYRILPYSHPPIDRLLRHRWAAAAVGSFALLGMVAAFAVAPAADHSRADLQTVLERLSPPTATLLEAGDDPFLREEPVRRGDTLASLLIRLGVTDRDALHFLRSDRHGRRLAQQLRPGTAVTARSGAGGELHTLSVPLTGKDASLVIKRRGKDFVIREQAMELEAQTVVKSTEVISSWIGATQEAGIPEAVASQLIGIFGSEVDFHRDLRNGDRLSLVYETFNHGGQTVRHGRILAAEMRSNQRVLQAFWFQPEQSGGAYYTADGYSLRKTFLRSPIELSQVNSGFAGERLHPILQTWRAHKGVDYPAPRGTPVLAVADGIVETAEYQNNGYGNLIVIKHHGTYSSAYGHLSHFASGLRKDTPVRQGDTIGYVGQTGLATGPHLHYEFRINDEQVDPLTLALPTSTPLEGSQKGRYMSSSAALRAQLERAGEMSLAAIE
jgi:murein DD-endopeptidase MepM/ murein hydrolase activator NlpD